MGGGWAKADRGGLPIRVIHHQPVDPGEWLVVWRRYNGRADLENRIKEPGAIWDQAFVRGEFPGHRGAASPCDFGEKPLGPIAKGAWAVADLPVEHPALETALMGGVNPETSIWIQPLSEMSCSRSIHSARVRFLDRMELARYLDGVIPKCWRKQRLK